MEAAAVKPPDHRSNSPASDRHGDGRASLGDCGVCGALAEYALSVTEDYSVPRCANHRTARPYQAESRLVAFLIPLRNAELQRALGLLAAALPYVQASDRDYAKRLAYAIEHVRDEAITAEAVASGPPVFPREAGR